MLGLDANILVYAHRLDAVQHQVAKEVMKAALAGKEKVTFTHTCLHEFIASVTNSNKYARPSTFDEVFTQIESWLSAPNASIILETESHFKTLSHLASKNDISSQKVYDAQIAAICIDNGVTEFITNDTGFEKFSELRIRNPFS